MGHIVMTLLRGHGIHGLEYTTENFFEKVFTKLKQNENFLSNRV